jgi:hypothetical protein
MHTSHAPLLKAALFTPFDFENKELLVSCCSGAFRRSGVSSYRTGVVRYLVLAEYVRLRPWSSHKCEVLLLGRAPGRSIP